MLRTLERGSYADLRLVLNGTRQAFDGPDVPVDGIVIAQFQVCAGVLLPNLRQLDFEPLRRLSIKFRSFLKSGGSRQLEIRTSGCNLSTEPVSRCCDPAITTTFSL